MAWYDTAQIPVIEAAMERKDWFTAIVLTATQLERHGYLEVIEYLESLNANSDMVEEIFEKTSLTQIAKWLLAIKKIEKKEYKTIMKINDERNKFVHRREKVGEEEKFKRGAEGKKKYEPLVKEAIRILKEKFSVVRLAVGKG